jgi:glycosyltransferase involved in cell wall biosynthesis
MKILHLITGLGIVGAEMMLFNLLIQPVFTRETCQVISLTEIGPLGTRIQQAGIPVQSLGMRPGRPDMRALWQLTTWLRSDPPDVIQTWMYHADLLGGLAARLAGNIPVLWGLHHTLDGDQPVQPRTMLVLRLNALLSGWLPRRVVCCAESARQAHIRVGYSPKRMVVIPNGVDLEKFHPDPGARSSLRHELGLHPETQLIGLFARFHPQKDHRTFAEAAGRLHARLPKAHFVLAGEGITTANVSLQDWFQAAGLSTQVHLLGLRQDMPRLMAGVDIASLSSSYGEALPLSIAETMACGVPCVVTAVGDAVLLVGDTGRTVPPRDPAALSEAWEELLSLSEVARGTLGQRARVKIQVGYNIIPVAARYASLYASILS